MDFAPLIMVAPNGARRRKADHPQLPITIEETAHTAAACAAAGAHALHAHIRDDAGAHSLDAGRYRDLLAACAAAAPTLPVQITTESAGIYAPAAQRQLLYDLHPAWASIAVREAMADGDMKATRRLYHWAAAEGVRLQHIVYAPQEVRQLRQHLADGVLPAGKCEVLFVLGQYTPPVDGAPAMLQEFLAAYAELPAPKRFMACAFGKAETACLQAAAAAAGDCRVGFENNLHNADGQMAKDNAERVGEVVEAVT